MNLSFNHDAQSYKKEVKRLSGSGDILCEKSSNLISRENFAVKSQEADY